MFVLLMNQKSKIFLVYVQEMTNRNSDDALKRCGKAKLMELSFSKIAVLQTSMSARNCACNNQNALTSNSEKKKTEIIQMMRKGVSCLKVSLWWCVFSSFII